MILLNTILFLLFILKIGRKSKDNSILTLQNIKFCMYSNQFINNNYAFLTISYLVIITGPNIIGPVIHFYIITCRSEYVTLYFLNFQK